METFSFLSDNTEAVEAFVKETYHVTNGRSSQFTKLHQYRHYFPDMVARPKYTGFEKIYEVDQQVRQKLMEGERGWLVDGIKKTKVSTSRSYMDIMSEYINSLHDENFVFFSGGLDSEFVIRLFQKFNKPFTPIVFVWKYGKSIINVSDFSFATDFCKQTNLRPIIKMLNIQDLWMSEKMYQISQQIKDTSPQRCTYKFASDMVAEEFPNHNRIFAGEIRYTVIK